jgi:Asp-tRNA(Asn)/Glu-tRNA(Gln) amidotransferase A subunit family amidase
VLLMMLLLLPAGVFDMAYNFAAIRFTQAANLTGLPALVLPGGRQMGMSLPVG